MKQEDRHEDGQPVAIRRSRRIEGEPGIDHEPIGVAASKGVITLSGTVRSYAEKMLAEKAARRIKGVRAVAEELKVQCDWQPKTSDTEIAKRVADILEWDPLVPKSRINVTVQDGEVKLEGTVDWNYQRNLAAEDAGKISGVVRISNRIAVAAPVAAADVRQKIEKAFERQADLESERICIEATGGKVTLSGSVRSLERRNVAERATWAAPGVVEIEDKLVVA